MLIAEMDKVKKFYGDRLILSVDNFKIYDSDRIGIVGFNGAGKTTLLNILTGKNIPDEGRAYISSSYSYITQLDFGDEKADEFNSKRFGVSNGFSENMSGGEKTRLKIAAGLSKNNMLIIADEPTSNLDREGIELFQKELKKFEGALLIVSHDREFLDEVCNEILEIEDGTVKLYKGNYTKYKELKQQEKERAQFEYESYIKEKVRIEEAIEETRTKVKSMKKAPSRMGNSEARLHKMGNQKAKANLDRAVKNMEARIEKLEVKERPKNISKALVDIQKSSDLHCRIVVSSDSVSKSFGDKTLFSNAEFKVFCNSKTAVIGANGSGKTTLIKMIIEGHKDISRAQGMKIGYFSQDMSILKVDKTLLENVMKDSLYDETFVRILLARLLFKREDINKKVSVLSGGERVKAAIAKIIVGDFNVLVLDEPTNYLDIYSMEAVEEALKDYDNTVLFVSHDRRFVNNVADHIISIENKKIITFTGTLEEYFNRNNKPNQKDNLTNKKMILQNRLSEIIGRISMPSKGDNIEVLDMEYKEILKQLQEI